MDKIKSIKIAIILTYIFLGLLIVFAAALPWAVSWYVEAKHRSETLAAIVMVTCYPCAPFAAMALFFLSKLLKNVLKKGLLTDENMLILKKLCVCCSIIAVITLVAGKFYMPFFLVSATFIFVSLLIFALRAALCIVITNNTN